MNPQHGKRLYQQVQLKVFDGNAATKRGSEVEDFGRRNRPPVHGIKKGFQPLGSSKPVAEDGSIL